MSTGLSWVDQIGAARLRAIGKWPWMQVVLFSLMPVEAKGLNTLGVTRNGVLLVDPEALSRWTLDELAGVLVHECGHLIQDHATRREQLSADPKLWNIAADMELNDDLKNAGWALPEGGGLQPTTYNYEEGLLAEEYYQKIVEDNPDIQNKGPANGNCGGAAGNPGDGEESYDQEADGGRSETEMNAIRRETAAAIQQEASSGRGSVPAGYSRWADELLQPPKIDWRTKLTRLCRRYVAKRAGAVDMAYHRPSRRQAGLGFGPGCPVLPKYFAPVPLVGIAVDTSGSMGEDELAIAVSETNGVLKKTSADVMFVACDADISDPIKRIDKIEDLKKCLKGGGGTDFRPVFAAFSKLPKQQRPETIIFITDGGGVAPAAAPQGYTVIWVIVGPYACIPYREDGGQIDWGEIIEIKDIEEGA